MNTSLTSLASASVAFVGGGQMASAIIAGLLQAGHSASSILVVEPMDAQRRYLEETFDVRVLASAEARLVGAAIVVWAVKPQAMRQIVADTQLHLGDALHVSIAAGLPLETLSGWLKSDRVVRAMPNTGALVGASVTGMAAAAGVSAAERQQAEAIFAAIGHCFWVSNDAGLDAVTAISGSGPAYVFHFLESFQAAAEALGFDPATARDIVLRTAEGAVAQARRGESFVSLRTRVTSKGGTTEAALKVLDSSGAGQALFTAVQAARARAESLSADLTNAI